MRSRPLLMRRRVRLRMWLLTRSRGARVLNVRLRFRRALASLFLTLAALLLTLSRGALLGHSLLLFGLLLSGLPLFLRLSLLCFRLVLRLFLLRFLLLLGLSLFRSCRCLLLSCICIGIDMSVFARLNGRLTVVRAFIRPVYGSCVASVELTSTRGSSNSRATMIDRSP